MMAMLGTMTTTTTTWMVMMMMIIIMMVTKMKKSIMMMKISLAPTLAVSTRVVRSCSSVNVAAVLAMAMKASGGSNSIVEGRVAEGQRTIVSAHSHSN